MSILKGCSFDSCKRVAFSALLQRQTCSVIKLLESRVLFRYQFLAVDSINTSQCSKVSNAIKQAYKLSWVGTDASLIFHLRLIT